MPITVNDYFTRLYADEAIIVGPTDGTETLADSDDVFTGVAEWVRPDFTTWGTSVPCGTATEEQAVEVHQMRQDADFQTMFGSFGLPLADLYLSQGQIRRFAKEHKDKLHPSGWATFFLFYMGEEDAPFDEKKLFVSSVFGDSSKLKARPHRLDSPRVWYGKWNLRVVVPQLS